jgi:hypothetical protein
MGRIAPGLLYRSAHPVSIITKEEKTVITRAAIAAAIETVLNLSDSPHEMQCNTEFTPWYNKIVKAGNALALGMDFHIMSTHFCANFAEAVRFMLDHPAPYLFHCFAGVDRTGFFAMVLEGFMGAKLFEIIDDYLISIYGNPIPARSSSKYKREAVHVRSILAAMNDVCDVNDGNLRGAAIGYLKGKAGLSDEELIALDKKLSGSEEKKDIGDS